MASPFDDLDRRKLDEVYNTVQLTVKQVAQLQSRIDTFLKYKRDTSWGRRYLRKIIKQLRETVKEQKGYINELENELRLKGLE